MATTMKLIAKQTLGATAASVSFTGIPATYTDLLLLGSCNNASAAVDNVRVRFNGATTDANHSGRRLSGNGSAASSTSDAYILLTATWAGSGQLANFEMYLPNYAGSTNKSLSATGVVELNSSTAYIYATAGLWSSTAAVTQLTLDHLSGSVFSVGSSFYLYGITRSDDNSPGTFGIQATGGDEVFIANGYKVHVFKSSGTFNVTSPGFIEYLVIGGGGAGGHFISGGGGAGGYRSSVGAETSGGGASTEAKPLLKAGSYSVIVGGGGAGVTTGTGATSGSQSSLGSITSTGGGRGGLYFDYGGANGGSGGGAGTNTTSQGTGTSGQGYNGGTGVGPPTWGCGGGGGAGAVGVSGTTNTGGSGGAGVASSITGVSVTRAGGGGGAGETTKGTGGSGGGGSAAFIGQTVGDGQVNTGSGGGGHRDGQNTRRGGNGGSGVVIIRYPIS